MLSAYVAIPRHVGTRTSNSHLGSRPAPKDSNAAGLSMARASSCANEAQLSRTLPLTLRTGGR